MSLILNIDTAIDTAYASIAQNGTVLHELSNEVQKDHGGFLQPAIKTLIEKTGIDIRDIDAIAVAAGPGSYTGLRVGMATAKGLSFALNKPLITIGTLEIIASSAIHDFGSQAMEQATLFCPMIDARRMEVYTALYDKELNIHLPPCALILNPGSFANWLLKNKVYFFGNGSKKWESMCPDPNAIFLAVQSNALAISRLSFKKFENNDFADVAYAEPLYLKDFHAGPINTLPGR